MSPHLERDINAEDNRNVHTRLLDRQRHVDIVKNELDQLLAVSMCPKSATSVYPSEAVCWEDVVSKRTSSQRFLSFCNGTNFFFTDTSLKGETWCCPLRAVFPSCYCHKFFLFLSFFFTINCDWQAKPLNLLVRFALLRLLKIWRQLMWDCF